MRASASMGLLPLRYSFTIISRTIAKISRLPLNAPMPCWFPSPALKLLSVATLTTVLASCLIGSYHADDATAQDLFDETMTAMAALPQPSYIVYRLEGSSDEGVQIQLTTNHGYLWFQIRRGEAQSTWAVVHRSRDSKSAVLDIGNPSAPANAYVTQRAFFDPTWKGSYDALVSGMYFGQHETTQPEPRVPRAPGAQQQGVHLPVIAVVRTGGSSFYAARDAGQVSCPNGDAGERLNIIAKYDSENHQLVGATIDKSRKRFCSLTFMEPDQQETSVEQHYEDVAGYWLQSGGVVSVRWHVLPFGTVTYHWHYQLLHISTPKNVPGEVFK